MRTVCTSTPAAKDTAAILTRYDQLCHEMCKSVPGVAICVSRVAVSGSCCLSNAVFGALDSKINTTAKWLGELSETHGTCLSSNGTASLHTCAVMFPAIINIRAKPLQDTIYASRQASVLQSMQQKRLQRRVRVNWSKLEQIRCSWPPINRHFRECHALKEKSTLHILEEWRLPDAVSVVIKRSSVMLTYHEFIVTRSSLYILSLIHI